MSWLQRVLLVDDRKGWRERARESIVDLNDGIVPAAGTAEGFAVYAEERTEWEMHHRMVEAERASIEADPSGEFEELAAAYEAKGLETGLAAQVAAALTARDPVAAHADAELDLRASRPPARTSTRRSARDCSTASALRLLWPPYGGCRCVSAASSPSSPFVALR
jgi:VIT family protein